MKKFLYSFFLISFISQSTQAQTTINLAPCSNCVDTAYLINDTTIFVSGDTIRLKSVLNQINVLINTGGHIKGKNLTTTDVFIKVAGGDSSVLKNVQLSLDTKSLRDSVLRWVRDSITTLLPAELKWFHMPSISISTSAIAAGQTKDLYNLYKAEFNAPAVKSAGAPAGIAFFSAPTLLYYYVTYYDPTVFANISINANGVMTYDVIGNATDCSLINIVFAVK